MKKRQDGFTLIEILVVITIIAALVGLVTLLIPKGDAERKKVQCLNNLRNIGGMLVTGTSTKKSPEFSGAKFLLQVASKLKDDELKVYICPGDEAVERPEAGTDEFVKMYRENLEKLKKLDEDTLRNLTSYAGPNWKKYPYSPMTKATQYWGCDACTNRSPYHPGICMLKEDGSAVYVEFEKLEGQEEEQINVGPGSGDKRLQRMIFYPMQ